MRRRLGAGTRWVGRDARLFALGQRPTRPAVDRLLLDRREAALVVGDDQHELELVELCGRLEVGGLDDVVGVAPDVDDLADEQALRVGRADAAAQLDAGGHDLVADRDGLARVDLAHDQDAAELSDDLAGRRVRGQLADDGRSAVGQQDDLGTGRSDLDDPTDQGATGRDRHVADGDPVVGPLVEHDQPPELGRLARDDASRPSS